MTRLSTQYILYHNIFQGFSHTPFQFGKEAGALKRVTLLDTTLRDGAQSSILSLSVEDKRAIAHVLDELEIHYIEGGYPKPSEGDPDMAFFKDAPVLRSSRLAAFGATRRKGVSAEADTGLLALAEAGTQTVVLFGKAWLLQVTDVLGCTPEENLRMIEDSVSFLKSRGREVIFDAEHFFDGYRQDSAYALETLTAAQRGGADILCLCDTRGGVLPDEAYEIVKTVCATVERPVGIHAHNDAGVAVAVSMMAVFAGAEHVQGTLCGVGERCGNADLIAIAAGLQRKRGYACLPPDSLVCLTSAARRVSELCNLAVPENQPYVGGAAFAHKAGMHIDGVMKNPESFEHLPPEAVGNTRTLMITDHSGRAQVLPILRRVLPEAGRESEEMALILRELRERQRLGYVYEAAEASFELMIRDKLGLGASYFELVNYTVFSEGDSDGPGGARALVKVCVKGQMSLAAGDGDGPVNALDGALRTALRPFYPELGEMRLTDYKVRVLNPSAASAATVRVLVASSGGGRDWSTIGVSTDIIIASWQALFDSVRYFLTNSE